MYSNPIGISILTNGNRCTSLKSCIDRLLAFCYYRPLIIGILDNGSTDDTWSFISEKLKDTYGVQYIIQRSEVDMGCAWGTNASCELVRHCEYSIHLESDFDHLSPDESGEDRLWLRRSVEFMQDVDGHFMYLRRMTGETEMIVHWWSQWMNQIAEQRGLYLSCPNFWWSNNPALCNNQALYANGTLPLNVRLDGNKGTSGWSQPELKAKAPGRAWIHK